MVVMEKVVGLVDKNKLKAVSRACQILGKLADKALAALPRIIGLILSWILNRAKEVVGWLPQNLWALITGVDSGGLLPLTSGVCHFDPKSSTRKSGNLPKIETQKSGNPKR